VFVIGPAVINAHTVKAILGTSARTESYSVEKLKSGEPAKVPHGASE
jgi:hypothetical protein